MSHRVVFVVGPPGVGKTKALEGLLDPFTTALVLRPKWTISPPVALVGHYGDTCGGGDTVPYDGAATAVDYWFMNVLPDEGLTTTVLDGDGFSTIGILRRLQGQGLDPICILLQANEDTLTQRRANRNSKQSPTWMKGRATKALNFSHMFDDAHRYTIWTDGVEPHEVTKEIATLAEVPSRMRQGAG